MLEFSVNRELVEEVGAKAGGNASETWFAGFARLLYRGGKPDFFSVTFSESTHDDLQVRHMEFGELVRRLRFYRLPEKSVDGIMILLESMLYNYRQNREYEVLYRISPPLYLNVEFAYSALFRV